MKNLQTRLETLRTLKIPSINSKGRGGYFKPRETWVERLDSYTQNPLNSSIQESNKSSKKAILEEKCFPSTLRLINDDSSFVLFYYTFRLLKEC